MNLSENERLYQWNSEIVTILIPDDVVLAIYIFLGIFGNGIVLIVYKVRFPQRNIERYFIPYLAVSDLLASIICGSFCIVHNIFPATFKYDELCKVYWFFCAFITYFSILILLVIAVQRYRKVVQPFERQMDIKMNRIALTCSFCVSVIVAIATPVLYGTVPFPNPENDIVGQRCGKIKDKNKEFSIFYGIVIGFLVLTVVGALIGMYAKMGLTIFRHMRNRRKFACQIKSDYSSANQTNSAENATEVSDIESADTIDVENNSTRNIQKTNKVLMISIDVDKKEKETVTSNHAQVNQRVMNRFTLMFMLITIIFLICYIPKVCLMLNEAKNPNFWETLNDRDRAGILFIYRIFIINNVANPFIYAFLDTKFRNELCSLCFLRKRQN